MLCILILSSSILNKKEVKEKGQTILSTLWPRSVSTVIAILFEHFCKPLIYQCADLFRIKRMRLTLSMIHTGKYLAVDSIENCCCFI